MYKIEREDVALCESSLDGKGQLKPKTFTDTFMYNKVGNYETNIINFIMMADRIDTLSSEFTEIKYDIKRRAVSNSLMKVLDSPYIILGTSEFPLTKSFKIFTASDLKDGKKISKVFIDCTGLISKDDGIWTCDPNKIDVVVSYLISAACQRIYFSKPEAFSTSNMVVNKGSEIFSTLVNYVIDYIYKINTIPSQKQRLVYMTTMYYLVNILSHDPNDDRTMKIAIKKAEISEKEAEIIDLQTPADAYVNIKTFIDAVAKVLRLPKLALDIFVEKWGLLYGPGTQFALELFPSFSTVITDAYVGAYINNQKTIEKVLGKKLVEFSTEIIQIETRIIS